MAREWVVKFLGYFVKLRKTRPRNVGKIMVLAMVASVVHKDIEPAVVTKGFGRSDSGNAGRVLGEGLLFRLKNVMLGNEVAGNRVPGTSQEP